MINVEQGQRLSYNSLRDGHLVKYFSKPCNRQHLQKAGLVRCNGEIVPEATIYEEGFKKDQQKRTQDAILWSLESRKDDLQRSHQALCLKTLDEIEKIERVRRIRSGRKKSTDVCCEDLVEFSIAPSGVCHRPLTAIQPDAKNCWTMSMNDSSNQRVKSAGLRRNDYMRSNEKNSLSSEKHSFGPSGFQGRSMSGKNGLSPYLQPQRSACPDFWLVAPKSRSPRKSGRGKRFQRKNKPLQPFIPPGRREDTGQLVMLTMKYYGDGLCLESDRADQRDEVLIEQQHCGGNTLYVFRDKLVPGTEFSFPSYRHPGYPFSLTIYVNGRYDGRLSVCCEYKHRLNARLGGRNGHFAIVRVKGGSPCCRCLMKYASKTKKKSSKNLRKDQSESSDNEKDGEQETALSIYNPNDGDKLDVPVNDEEEEDDKEFRNFDKRTSEIQSPDSVRKAKTSKEKEKKKNPKLNEKDGYDHFLYDIKVPVDDDGDDDDGDSDNANSKRKQAAKGSPAGQRPAGQRPAGQRPVHRSVDSESAGDSQEELDKVKPKSSRSQRGSSDDDESDYTGS